LVTAFSRCLCLMLFLLANPCLRGQESDSTPIKPPEDPGALNALPRPGGYESVPHGLNAGVAASGVHDSSIGWYNVVTPGISYTFSRRYAADASMSIYPYRLTPKPKQAAPSGSGLVFDGGDVGDLLVEGHAIFEPGAYRIIPTAAMTIPTGNRLHGLGTGRVTFNFDDRIERYFGQTGVIVDVGAGDSSGLTNRLVTEDDNGLGPLAQFQAGFVFWLPNSISIQSVAYEQLPIGDQKTYATIGAGPMGPGSATITVVTGRKVAEDNGLTTSLYVPLTSRWMLTSSYNRSLRLHLDTASVGLSFVWKGIPIKRKPSLIDRAMYEAEFGRPIVAPVQP
jgi:hypothetical protein